MSELLFKVSEPRSNLTFEPRPFWRAEDWSFSDDRPRDGLIEDCVLYAAEFDDVSIHLLPKVWRLRVWVKDDARRARLEENGFTCSAQARAVIFALESDRTSVESFCPTIFAFDPSGFERMPTNEFVSRRAQTAVSVETLTMQEVLERWRFDLVYVANGDDLAATLRSSGIDHEIQT